MKIELSVNILKLRHENMTVGSTKKWKTGSLEREV